MNGNKYIILILTLIVSIVGIVASSIGINFYNKCSKLHDDSNMKRNRNFLVALIIIIIIIFIGTIYFVFKPDKSYKTLVPAAAISAAAVPAAAVPAAAVPAVARFQRQRFQRLHQQY